ncbi:hypothetical protein BT93_L1245 [Corymbia citriodora subsp. variegata]|uniref:Uncharacterized protein n=1 Tax=Corymbia citriodora subsp. variegata TaxID=360336 RepID=A0A8T0CSM4_CORYI|nr:hypothetical protein BT93_L1245 [Corymbia citriodora subsp. variegata]KAF7849100.1 hypothetical protein BT93_L1245 [Corymbia citriodora subsp. variegata]KAF7849101.1 hypothetical protein BT93_L1245 [Corymbia citriodora subsp. variegata]KAF7849104.1 hypothetical protein BT93_L1245 [Corymbia citriodora subsp. variegata]
MASVGQAVPPPFAVEAADHNVPNANVEKWTTGLCDCFDDPSNCWITCFCPCVTFGQNAEIIDRGSTSCASAASRCCRMLNLFYCSWCYTCTYRTKLRGLYSIPGNQCRDGCLHYWCGPCALCQEYRELKNRGFDPSIGWVVNNQRRTRQAGTVVPPSVPGGMIR